MHEAEPSSVSIELERKSTEAVGGSSTGSTVSVVVVAGSLARTGGTKATGSGTTGKAATGATVRTGAGALNVRRRLRDSAAI